MIWLFMTFSLHCYLILLLYPFLRFSQPLRGLSGCSLEIFWSKIKLKQGLACYMVGKIFLYEISFNIVYNESGHKNMIPFFSQISILLKQRWRCVKQHCVVSNSDYFCTTVLVRTEHNWRVIFVG